MCPERRNYKRETSFQERCIFKREMQVVSRGREWYKRR